MEYLETQRLILRDWREEDLEGFIEMNKDPVVMKYFPNTLNREETTEIYNRITQHFQKWGYGLYVAELKSNKTFIGFIGLSHPRFESTFTPCVEIGWRLNKNHWGQGLATEGATKVLQYAFGELQLDEVYSFTAIQNVPSYRVMEKIGMKRLGNFDHPNLPTESELSDHWIYHLSKSSLHTSV